MTVMKLFEEQDCITCGVRFGVPEGFTQHHRNSKATFYCPNGHSMAYTESEADRLRRERDQLKQNEAWYEDRLKTERASRETAERKLAASKGQITKIKKRAANGVCPCCNRTFSDLGRHMHSKHPGYVTEPTADEHVH